MARQARRSSEPQFTESGAVRLDEIQAEFRGMVEQLAIQNARRRHAQGADNTDGDAAYRHLLDPRDRPVIVDISAEIGLYLAGALAGYGLTLLTANSPSIGPGWALLVGSAALAILCAIIKHVKL